MRIVPDLIRTVKKCPISPNSVLESLAGVVMFVFAMEALEMKCPRCSSHNPAGQKFCGNCGQALSPDPAFSGRGETAMGERKLVTVLFADVVGSTAMAERLDPEQVTEIMNGAFAFLNAAVARYGGTVARLMGDAVLALFGAPVAHEDDAERAVRAALDIQAAARDYVRGIERDYGIEFRMRVGINTGLAVLDMVGDQIRTEYTAMGDTTNVAARMQSAADPGSVLIGADTYRLVKSLFDFKPRGAIEVKGKSAPIEVFEVLAPKQTPGKMRGLEGLDSPLVGRDTEFNFLRHKIEGVCAGQGAFVAVIGEAGLGKSRLVAEACKSPPSDLRAKRPISNLQSLIPNSLSPREAPDLHWLEGRSISYGQSISYYPWRQIIRQSIGAQEGDSPAEVRKKLRFACECCTLPGGDVSFLEAMLAVEDEESLKVVQGYEGEALVQRMIEATRGYLCAAAQMFPLMLVFDDLHWADEASLELLLNVANLTENYPLLIVCLLRPDKDAASWSFVERARRRLGDRFSAIALEPLSTADSRELLGNLLFIEDLPDSVRDLILRKSEGNPFFVEEVIRSLIDSRHIVRENSHWRAAREIVNVAIPNTLAGVLSARIDRLPDDAKRVAQMAAVVGRIFAYRLLETICASAPPGERIADLDPHLSTLVSEEIVRERTREPELEYIFKHVLTQEAAYQSLLIKRRKEFHRRAGMGLEQLYADRLASREFAPTLAHHFWQADEWARAAEYSLRSAARAAQVYALREALGHYERALEALDKLPSAPPGQMCDALLGWTQAAFKTEPYTKLVERLTRAEKIARELHDKRRLTNVLHWIASVHLGAGFNMRAAPALMECFQLASEIGDERLSVVPSYYWAFFMVDRDPRGALDQFERVLELARKYQNKDIEAHAIATIGMAHARLGEFEQAQQNIQQALEFVRGIHSPVKEADVHNLAGFTYLDMGDAQRGLAYGQIGAQKALAANAPDCASAGFFCVGLGHLQAQNLDEAQAAFGQVVALAELTGATPFKNLGQGGLAIAQFFSGRPEAAPELERALANARAIGDEFGAALFSQTLGEILTQASEMERAERHLTMALDYYRRTDMRPYLARALQSWAQLREKQGRLAEAGQARAESDRLLRECGVPSS